MKIRNHIGKIKSTNEIVLVAFRTLPGESNHALVIPTANLSDSYMDSLHQLLETIQAQESFEFGEILFTRPFPDGRPMLRALRADGSMHKVATDQVVMTPTTNDEILLSDLNVLIAEQRNCAVDDLCMFVSGAKPANTPTEIEEVAKVQDLTREVGEPKNVPLQANQNSVLSDADLAKSYRNQAASMLKEAESLRKQADELDPPAVIVETKAEVKVENKPAQKAPVVAKTTTTAAKPAAKPTVAAKPATTAKTTSPTVKSTVAPSTNKPATV